MSIFIVLRSIIETWENKPINAHIIPVQGQMHGFWTLEYEYKREKVFGTKYVNYITNHDWKYTLRDVEWHGVNGEFIYIHL